MKNLDQIRAASALAYAASTTPKGGADDGEVVKKIPGLIMGNGLLAAGAFAYSKGEGGGWYACFDALARHLADPQVQAVPPTAAGLKPLLECLSKEADSATLQVATGEALAWLGFARRFVKKPKAKGGEGDPEQP